MRPGVLEALIQQHGDETCWRAVELEYWKIEHFAPGEAVDEGSGEIVDRMVWEWPMEQSRGSCGGRTMEGMKEVYYLCDCGRKAE